MNPWVIEEPRRLLDERDAVTHLQEQTGWLSAAAWGWERETGKVYCEATIVSHSHEYGVRMTYPDLFPALPPEVRPLDSAARWSGHQYNNGTLCLEWGPDNWTPERTGADLLTSTHKLLEMENPQGDESILPQEPPSRHQLTLGQELRSEFVRILATPAWLAQGRALPAGSVGTAAVVSHNRAGRLMHYVVNLTAEGETWTDTTLPAAVRGKNQMHELGFLFRSSLTHTELTRLETVDDIRAILQAAGIEAWPGTENFSLTVQRHHALFLDEHGELHHFLMFEDQDGPHLFKGYSLLDDRGDRRLPPETDLLADKTIAIVGAGSVGSKVAVSLVRSGARRLLLVDPDVMLPGNIVRHALDWHAVGAHKVRALRKQLQLLAPDVVVEEEKVLLAGQESSGVIARVFSKLAKYDLLVDATADPQVFNLLASLAIRAKRPMVWGQVYAGGLGGLVARSRPGRDANPLSMRAAYLAFCQEQDAPVMLVGEDYATRSDQPMVATDADVGVIAHHLAQLALDTLTQDGESAFPQAMYLVGLRRGWIFDAPFQNHFIEVEAAEGTSADTVVELTSQEEAAWAGFLRTLLGGGEHADPFT
ncbi:ThiF family adenylyltransferase [Deinococcus ruber]|uniref:THIF-type NAD/FAD binding fold domain-containing protein n=1 Tax=Deinococcus ruber TaxID=1848197 RepID=A0A918CKQ5_9DEIO|nr:ThiF family adenylyltransferase [Deinococcus ruber]GGR30383.1 hypothetical protein GCM10008957_46480 [Deinococcus ruber]